jgi:hypothetical protein
VMDTTVPAHAGTAFHAVPPRPFLALPSP